MSLGLKPLLLPRLVERRKLDDVQTPPEAVDGSFVFLTDNTSSSDLYSPATPAFSHRSALGHLRSSSSSSSFDLAAPAPIVPDCALLPICLGPITNSVSPAPTAHSTNTAPKRLLPDVQEEDPLGRDDECSLYEDDDADSLAFPEDEPNLYDCLCDEPCFHGREDEAGSDFGFASDGDNARTTMRSDTRRKRYGTRRNGSRNGSVSGSSFGMGSETDRMGSPFTNLTLRVGSRIHALSRWRSGSSGSPRSGSNTYANLIGAPASEPALLPSLSRAPSRTPSSRSSLSVSRSVSRQPFSLGELTRSTSVSYYGSTDSLPSAAATNGATVSSGVGLTIDILDVQEEEVWRSMERDRAKATTPLLPPLFLDRLPPSPAATSMHSQPPSLQTSPIIASPTGGMFPDAITRVASTTTSPVFSDTIFFPGQPAMLSRINTTTATRSPAEVLPSPPLSTKQSVSSFRPPHVPHLSISGTSSNGSLLAPTPMSPQSVTAPTPLESHDEWSDRLGHANYTILPRPYRPTEVASR
ncbi:hypothetical protein CMQ_6672 [Grosmannia clavigera kw1407]|uniref:Uncharacterized protein n=1 Tax=Grosmannia clavigera (strain kw1407 / UAMH 11150) TaxID=655863 RepID=F0X7R8_GROCL|nr:uncharacterized protein CMQ_6672 [Grosmannia clavigera kw1407]EFX06351.1 hypothetical protein CMQ_6672 [Grosmannia clavigera kw1407]